MYFITISMTFRYKDRRTAPFASELNFCRFSLHRHLYNKTSRLSHFLRKKSLGQSLFFDRLNTSCHTMSPLILHLRPQSFRLSRDGSIQPWHWERLRSPLQWGRTGVGSRPRRTFLGGDRAREAGGRWLWGCVMVVSCVPSCTRVDRSILRLNTWSRLHSVDIPPSSFPSFHPLPYATAITLLLYSIIVYVCVPVIIRVCIKVK